MVNDQLTFGGLTGEVVFGEVNQDAESIPLTITLEETTFECDIAVRRNAVSCQAVSTAGEDFKVRVSCAIETEL